MKLSKFKLEFEQEPDCAIDCEDTGYNVVEVESVCNGINSYLVFKTERWAVDDIDELIKTLTTQSKIASLQQEINS